MTSRSTFQHCWGIIDAVDNFDDDDWEDTTREERHWMGVARELAVALAETTGYRRFGKVGSKTVKFAQPHRLDRHYVRVPMHG